MGALVVVFYYLFRDPLPSASSRPLMVGLDKLPLFFGTAIFAFEGIGIVLPIENRMKSPQGLPGFSGVLNTGMVMVGCLYIGIGFFGYLKFGPEVKPLYVAVSVLVPTLVKPRLPPNRWILAESAVRVGLVTTTFALAASIPYLSEFISLAGAVCMSSLSLIGIVGTITGTILS